SLQFKKSRATRKSSKYCVPLGGAPLLLGDASVMLSASHEHPLRLSYRLRQWRRTRCCGTAVACSLAVSTNSRRRNFSSPVCTALFERPVASAIMRRLAGTGFHLLRAASP